MRQVHQAPLLTEELLAGDGYGERKHQFSLVIVHGRLFMVHRMKLLPSTHMYYSQDSRGKEEEEEGEEIIMQLGTGYSRSPRGVGVEIDQGAVMILIHYIQRKYLRLLILSLFPLKNKQRIQASYKIRMLTTQTCGGKHILPNNQEIDSQTQ